MCSPACTSSPFRAVRPTLSTPPTLTVVCLMSLVNCRRKYTVHARTRVALILQNQDAARIHTARMSIPAVTFLVQSLRSHNTKTGTTQLTIVPHVVCQTCVHIPHITTQATMMRFRPDACLGTSIITRPMYQKTRAVQGVASSSHSSVPPCNRTSTATKARQ